MSDWMGVIIESYRDIADVVEGIAEDTDDDETQQRLEELHADLIEMVEHYE